LLFEFCRLLPWWKKWTYCNGLMTGYEDSDVIWWSVLNTWNNSNYNLLEFLSCSISPNIVRHYLNMIAISEDCIITDIFKSNCQYPVFQGNDRINSFLLTVAKNVNNIEILKYILDNFNYVKTR